MVGADGSTVQRCSAYNSVLVKVTSHVLDEVHGRNEAEQKDEDGKKLFFL